MNNQITNPKFFEGGKAIFTVFNNKGEHITYKIRKKGDSPFFVSLLTGPDNYRNYTYIGLYIPSWKAIKLTEKSKLLPESKPVKVFNWAVQQVWENHSLPEGYGIVHENKCCRCGRKLTTPESVENGIGPECIKYFNA